MPVPCQSLTAQKLQLSQQIRGKKPHTQFSSKRLLTSVKEPTEQELEFLQSIFDIFGGFGSDLISSIPPIYIDLCNAKS